MCVETIDDRRVARGSRRSAPCCCQKRNPKRNYINRQPHELLLRNHYPTTIPDRRSSSVSRHHYPIEIWQSAENKMMNYGERCPPAHRHDIYRWEKSE